MSQTYIGVIVLALSAFLKQNGLDLGTEQITNFILVGGQIVGVFVALYGRWRVGGIKWFGGRV